MQQTVSLISREPKSDLGVSNLQPWQGSQQRPHRSTWIINFPQVQKPSGNGHAWEGLLHLSLKIQGTSYSRLGAKKGQTEKWLKLMSLVLNWTYGVSRAFSIIQKAVLVILNSGCASETPSGFYKNPDGFSLHLKDLEFPGLSHRRLVFQKLHSCTHFIPLMLADVIATFIQE